MGDNPSNQRFLESRKQRRSPSAATLEKSGSKPHNRAIAAPRAGCILNTTRESKMEIPAVRLRSFCPQFVGIAPPPVSAIPGAMLRTRKSRCSIP